MQNTKQISFFTLLLLISFASVNAVLFTPALPAIASFFQITNDAAQQTITWFLIGYALGQLVYGPIANRFGRKRALYVGVGLQIISSLICIAAGITHLYIMLIIGRFLLALGSGVGLKMTFTLVNECYEPKIASKKISYLMLAFAITPGLAIALGGVLTAHFGWTSCFYAGAIYGVILLLFITRLPETLAVLHYDALKLKHLLHGYGVQFKNLRLIAGGLMMGSCSSFIYVFAAAAPFIAMNLLGMKSTEYGIANILPSIGLIAGSLCSARLAESWSLQAIIKTGIMITGGGVVMMIAAMYLSQSAVVSLFLPMTGIYFGLSLVIANATTVAMSATSDKAHGSAVMNFINMGLTTLIVLCQGFVALHAMTLPAVYALLCVMMAGLYRYMYNN